MEYKTVLFEKNEGIGMISINRPDALNALNLEAYSELFKVFSDIKQDADIGAIILTGVGKKSFVAGTDIATMSLMSPLEARAFSDIMRKTCDCICNFSKPVIAAVNGFALGGGCELALCADLRIASENAKFGQPEIKLGIIPGSGGTQRLARLIGLGKAKELIYSGNIIDATTALDWGLVNKVVKEEFLIPVAKEIAKNYLTKSRIILALAKVALNSSTELGLAQGLDIEQKCFVECFTTEDQKEGMQAFLEKRASRFQNK